MTQIGDYLLADCSLFRTPPVDTSKVSSEIEDALMNAWKRGVPAAKAIDCLVNDSKLVKTLVDQVAASLAFQREQSVRNVDEELSSKIELYEQEKKSKLSMIDQAYVGEAKKKEELVNANKQSFEEKHRTFTASQQKLEELRTRVASNIGEVNGENGLNKLREIRSYLQKDIAERESRTRYGQLLYPEIGKEETQDANYGRGVGGEAASTVWQDNIFGQSGELKSVARNQDKTSDKTLDKTSLDAALNIATKKNPDYALGGKSMEQILEEERQKSSGRYVSEKETVSTVYSKVKDFFKSTYSRMADLFGKKIF